LGDLVGGGVSDRKPGFPAGQKLRVARRNTQMAIRITATAFVFR
jgi:hypothetical protein